MSDMVRKMYALGAHINGRHGEAMCKASALRALATMDREPVTYQDPRFEGPGPSFSEALTELYWAERALERYTMLAVSYKRMWEEAKEELSRKPVPPPPPTREQIAAGAKKRKEESLRILANSGLQGIELQAAREQVHLIYLRNLDGVL